MAAFLSGQEIDYVDPPFSRTDMQSFRMPFLQVRSAFDPTAAAYQQQQAIQAFQAEKNVPIDAQWLEWELEG